MTEAAARPIVFLDFDDTITRGDVLDSVLERFAVGEDWQSAETEWQEGRISTRECLTRQVRALRVTERELIGFTKRVRLDPSFSELVALHEAQVIELVVLSDNFRPLVDAILRTNGFHGIDVRANDLTFSNDGIRAQFPWSDVHCPQCAHCKAQHLRVSLGRLRVFAGDGLSDVCPALIADVVFAKSTLARELAVRGVAFRPLRSLAEVAAVVRRLPQPESSGVGARQGEHGIRATEGK